MQLQRTTSAWDLVAAWAFLAVELSISVSLSTEFLLAWSSRKYLAIRPLLRLQGTDFPTVDIFIAYCGEGLDIILDTVRAVCALDYPQGRYRMIVLDDDNSAELEAEIERIRMEGNESLHYTARGVDVSTHSKAGNLNHGLDFSSNTLGGYDLIAVLDVDMIPLPHWLRALVPHLDDTAVGMANPPQSWYNLPSGDPLGQTVSEIFDVISPLQDSLGGAWCTGTGWVARRYAIDQIGGIPTESLSEDVLTSVFLLARGWRIAYVHERLQWGLVPDTFSGHLKQLQRWFQGTKTATAATLSAPGLSGREKLGSILYGATLTLIVYALVAAILIVPAILLTGKPFIIYGSPEQLKRLFGLSLLQLLTTWAYGFLKARATGYRVEISPMFRHLYIAPFFLLADLNASRFLPNLETAGRRSERRARHTGSILRRLKAIIWQSHAYVHLVIIVATVAGALVSQQAALAGVESVVGGERWQRVLVRAAWPQAFVLWTTIVVQCCRPFAYAIFPPDSLERSRECLLQREESTKVAYPTEEAMDQGRVRVSQRYAYFVLFYAICAVVAGFCM